MRIRSIQANNFKSLVDFDIPLAKFTCLIGLNGAGKSTVLHFVDFLAQQMKGDLEGWFESRSWQPKDINSKLTSKRTIEFAVEVAVEDGSLARWDGSFNTSTMNCTHERIFVQDARLEVQGRRVHVGNSEPSEPGHHTGSSSSSPVSFTYQGSILSQLREETLPKPLVAFKHFIASIDSLDLLSPEYLRQSTREEAHSLGLGGQRLAAFLHDLGHDQQEEISNRVKEVYTRLQSLEAKTVRFGWKHLEIEELFSGKRLVTEARHINDGMLRLIAILAELQTDHEFLLFDEIENGVNPEVIEFLLDALVLAPQQVMVTTHSPMILNYLDDEVARDGVIYLYKNRDGCSRAIPFFLIPSLKEKLKVMGPGEAFADTNLTQLGEEIEQITEV